MSIPHIVHYCWYGGGKFDFVLSRCVKSFAKLGDDHIIKCWNEENSGINDNELLKFLVDNKAWAFVSDYVRLKTLYDEGGIYLDTDIQIIKPLPEKYYEADMIVGYAYGDIVSTAFIMVRPGHPFIKYVLDILEGFLKDKRKVVNNGYFTQGFLDYFPDFKLDGKFREFSKGCFIYPRQYFDSATFKRNAGYCIHHGVGAWRKTESPLRKKLRPVVKYLRFYLKPFAVWYQNRVNTKMVMNSGNFLKIYNKNL